MPRSFAIDRSTRTATDSQTTAYCGDAKFSAKLRYQRDFTRGRFHLRKFDSEWRTDRWCAWGQQRIIARFVRVSFRAQVLRVRESDTPTHDTAETISFCLIGNGLL